MLQGHKSTPQRRPRSRARQKLMSFFMTRCCICGVREKEMASRPAMFLTFTRAPCSRSFVTRSNLSLATASLMGTWPWSSDWLGLALPCRSSSAAPACPNLQARCRGVVLVRSSTRGLAFLSISSCTTEAKPMRAAVCRAVLSVPSLTTTLTSASFLKRYLQMSRCPALAAPMSGVTPMSGSGMFTSALAWISSAATVRLPASHKRTRHLAASVRPSKPSTFVKSWLTSKLSSSSGPSWLPFFGLAAALGDTPRNTGAAFASPAATCSSIIFWSAGTKWQRLPSTKEAAAKRASCDACSKSPWPPWTRLLSTERNPSMSLSSATFW
mmetsp:Transcript_94466/g.281999  ORF Transcript_94466/g.281999 Transcript_94466/m.281999 type:complete len:326 (+) Transcript_94466:111-1088(+)